MTKLITITQLRDIADKSGIAHAEFCLEQHTSQFGRGASEPLWAELQRLLDADFVTISAA